MRSRPTESYGTTSTQDVELDRAVAQYWRKRRVLEKQIYGSKTSKAKTKRTASA